MPVLGEEELAMITVDPPWKMDGDELCGKMIMQVFGARKMVECKVVGWQKPEGSNMVIYRCIQVCDAEFCDLSRDEVIEFHEKWNTTREVKSLKNEITLAIEKIPIAIDVDNESELRDWLIDEVKPLVEIQQSIEELISKNPEVKKCVELCKKQAKINQRLKRDTEAIDDERSRKKSFMGCF
mmetsp:Transcript_14674/g.30156  ORF Transcript_14674/g.30156 Transcript_14674/m.30156 type:complete len:182 (-) Transcript_14674:46-591(-)|eukprot:CAMPEP_0118647732 /NCGR_PEP_ID=MMETSP0785-20121206/8768_1 /TAXON_ID=91992 /ORGANISM="Bolidomonas pacifica, Strain CCMP 1866" /LENGTH=181 /DNA_ID=CAMNT_0006539855 /DNA_START=40 /DNA_END=585 /DNA_ORIENTATION=+